MIGTKPARVLALISLTFSAAALLPAEERMRTGLWGISTTVDGKSAGPSRSMCYTPDMVEATNAPPQMLRQATEKALTKDGLCKLNDFKLEGGKASMTVACGAKSTVYVSTYSGDSFETVISSTVNGAPKVVTIKGRRTGACP